MTHNTDTGTRLRIEMARLVVLPDDFTGGRVQCVDMSTVVIYDSRSTIRDTILNRYSTGDRPGGHQ